MGLQLKLLKGTNVAMQSIFWWLWSE